MKREGVEEEYGSIACMQGGRAQLPRSMHRRHVQALQSGAGWNPQQLQTRRTAALAAAGVAGLTRTTSTCLCCPQACTLQLCGIYCRASICYAAHARRSNSSCRAWCKSMLIGIFPLVKQGRCRRASECALSTCPHWSPSWWTTCAPGSTACPASSQVRRQQQLSWLVLHAP